MKITAIETSVNQNMALHEIEKITLECKDNEANVNIPSPNNQKGEDEISSDIKIASSRTLPQEEMVKHKYLQ